MHNNLPFVTTLIGMLDKPALLKWANKIGLEGKSLDDARTEFKTKGSNWHMQIEDYLKHDKPFVDVSFGERFAEWLSDKEVLDVEKSVATEYFCGRLDIRYRQNGLIFLADFKSNQKTVYYENKLQLAAYRMAEPCNRVVLVSVPDMRTLPVYIPDFEPYEQILIHLSKIYHLQTQLK